MRGVFHFAFGRVPSAATPQQGRWKCKGEEWEQWCPHQQCHISVSKCWSLPTPCRLGRFPSLGSVCCCAALSFLSPSAPLNHFTPRPCDDKLANSDRGNRSHRLWPCKWGWNSPCQRSQANPRAQQVSWGTGNAPVGELMSLFNRAVCGSWAGVFPAFLTACLLECSAWCWFWDTWDLSASTPGFLCEEFEALPSCLWSALKYFQYTPRINGRKAEMVIDAADNQRKLFLLCIWDLFWSWD